MNDILREYLILHSIGLLTGCIADLIIGDPHGIPHPIVAIGRLISSLEIFLGTFLFFSDLEFNDFS